MTFKEKIDKILELNTLQIDSVSALEDEIGAGRGAINNFYNENREPGRMTLKRIKTLPGLNLDWWETGEGPVFIAGSGENLTDGDIKPPVAELALGRHERAMVSFQEALKEESPYRVVPKSILEGKYALYLETEIKEKNDLLWIGLKAKDELINQLKEEIRELRDRLSGPPEKTQ